MDIVSKKRIPIGLRTITRTGFGPGNGDLHFVEVGYDIGKTRIGKEELL
jgi:hypothetical protein